MRILHLTSHTVTHTARRALGFLPFDRTCVIWSKCVIVWPCVRRSRSMTYLCWTSRSSVQSFLPSLCSGKECMLKTSTCHWAFRKRRVDQHLQEIPRFWTPEHRLAANDFPAVSVARTRQQRIVVLAKGQRLIVEQMAHISIPADAKHLQR